MSEESVARENQRIAYEIQAKFEFWLLGLIFAVLALAVQTADFSGPRIGQVCELIAWLTLLLAGLGGLWRLERTPSLFHLGSRRAIHEDVRQKVQEVKLAGHQTIYVVEADRIESIDAFLEKVDKNIATVDKGLGASQKKQVGGYRMMRALLLVGFVLLLVARGYGPALALIHPTS